MAFIHKKITDLTDTDVIKAKDSINLSVGNRQSAIESDLQIIKKEDLLDKAYSQLYDDKNLEKMTQLTDEEVSKLTIIKAYAKKYDFTELSDLVDAFCKYRVSLGREGRKEMVSIAQANLIREDERFKHMEDMKSLEKRG